MNPLKLKDQWGYSETGKNECASISYETKTAHKISSRNSALGKTKVYGQGSEKKIGSICRQNKSNIFWLLGSVFF